MGIFVKKKKKAKFKWSDGDFKLIPQDGSIPPLEC